MFTFLNCKNHQDIVEKFQSTSAILLNGYSIKTPKGIFKIGAVELYLYTFLSEIHQDKWCDCNKEQLKSQTWYVKNASLNRSRIDITAGDFSNQIYGAYLIQMISGQPARTGSATALKTLLKGYDFTADWHKTDEEKALLSSIHGQSIWHSKFCLITHESNLKGKINFGPRVFKTPKGRDFEQAPLRASITY